SIVRISSELKLPVKGVAFGESCEDFEEFSPERFVERFFEAGMREKS
ncbi:MAG TPA: signal recognition particle-docking protein FtsY, partial [Firmicutes bacterium]|nr:signal recognition particle-docking protein FtsY [Bacillota bacterium]